MPPPPHPLNETLQHGYTTLLLSSRNICMSNVFSEIQVFKCYLCACAANDASRFATGGPPQESFGMATNRPNKRGIRFSGNPH